MFIGIQFIFAIFSSVLYFILLLLSISPNQKIEKIAKALQVVITSTVGVIAIVLFSEDILESGACIMIDSLYIRIEVLGIRSVIAILEIIYLVHYFNENN